MITTVHVLTEEDFNLWYAATKSGESTAASKETTVTPAMLGKQLVQKIGCNACHSIDGTKIVGPSYKGVFGHEVTVMTDGKERTLVANEEYIRRSILDPNADVVKGFNKGLMLSYKDQVTEEQIQHIIEYIKTLQ